MSSDESLKSITTSKSTSSVSFLLSASYLHGKCHGDLDNTPVGHHSGGSQRRHAAYGLAAVRTTREEETTVATRQDIELEFQKYDDFHPFS